MYNQYDNIKPKAGDIMTGPALRKWVINIALYIYGCKM
jgi:hypothetical protein